MRNPVLEREIKTRVRDWKSPFIICAYICALGAVMLLYFYSQAQSLLRGHAFGPEIGFSAFVLLAYLQLFLVAFIAPAISVGAISSEVERQTFDLLWTSRLNSRSVILGKLSASIAYLLLVVLASIPLYAVIFFFGGLDLRTIGLLFLIYLVTGVTYASISILFSAITRRTTVATVLTYCTLFFLIVGTLAISALQMARIHSQPPDPNNPWRLPPKVLYLNPVVALGSALPGGRYDFLPAFRVQSRPVLVYHGAAPPPPPPALAPHWQYHVGVETVITLACLGLAMLFVDPTSKFRQRKLRGTRP